MIYTIGKAALYDNYILKDPNPCKAGKRLSKLFHGHDRGGSVWESYEEAELFARASTSSSGEQYNVYGVMGVDWAVDTAPVGNATFHELLKEGKLVMLC